MRKSRSTDLKIFALKRAKNDRILMNGPKIIIIKNKHYFKKAAYITKKIITGAGGDVT